MNMTKQELTSYWATVCVFLTTGVRGESGEVLRGYYVNIGLWSSPEDVKNALARTITDGVIDWSDTSIEYRMPHDFNMDAQYAAALDTGNCVWYRSGRTFFSD